MSSWSSGFGLSQLLLLVCSLVFAFGLAEVYLSWQVPESGLTPSRSPEFPGLTHQLRPSFATLYHGTEITTNKSGFRGPDIQAKRAGHTRIALIGDSVTFGHVPWNDTLNENLRRSLEGRDQRVEVLNFGVPGYDAAHIATMLEHQVIRHAPDIIVYIFFYNDVPPTTADPPQDIDPAHTVDLRRTFFLSSAFAEWLGRLAKGMARAGGLDSSAGYVAFSLSKWTDAGEQRVRTALARMVRLAKEHDACFAAAIAPNLVPTRTNPFREIEEGFARIAAQFDIAPIDLRTALGDKRKIGAYQVGLFDNHPNPEANHLMATYLASELLGGSCGDAIRDTQTARDPVRLPHTNLTSRLPFPARHPLARSEGPPRGDP